MASTTQNSNSDDISPILLLTISPGRLGLTVNFANTHTGAVITEIDTECTFKDQLDVGDRIVTIDGVTVGSIEDLSKNKDRLRKFGIVKKKNTNNITTDSVAAATQRLQRQQAAAQQYILRTQQEQRASKKRGRKQPAEKVDKHPLVGLTKHNGKYSIRHQTEVALNLSQDELMDRLQTFIESLSQSNCTKHQFKGYTSTSCTCLHFLQNMPKVVHGAIGQVILDYLDMSYKEKKQFVVERMRFAKIMASRNGAGDGLYVLPISYEYLEEQCNMDDDDTSEAEADSSQPPSNQQQLQHQQISAAFSHGICANAFFRLLNIGPTAEKRHKQYIDGDLSSSAHQNAGKKRKRKTDDAMEDVRSSLQALHDEYVHSDECKRKGNEFTLPVSISKRNFYEEWCRKRGWEAIKTDTANGCYARVADYRLLDGYFRTEEDAALAQANGRYVFGIAKGLVSFANFHACWSDQFPNMKTQGRVGKGQFIGDQYGSGKWDRNR